MLGAAMSISMRHGNSPGSLLFTRPVAVSPQGSRTRVFVLPFTEIINIRIIPVLFGDRPCLADESVLVAGLALIQGQARQ
jgi:hypothetical protein